MDLEQRLRASVAYVAERKRQMTEAIVKAENGNGMAIAPAMLEFSEEQRRLIRDTYANGASDSEFAVLLEIAKARRLNPFTRQIHFVKRYDKQKQRDVWAAQASIDGLRAVAERTRLYDGQDEPVYEYDHEGKLMCCRVKVWRKDWSRPVVGIAYYSEYVQVTRDGGPNSFWKEKPHVMLAKCAEALALRKAFPEDAGGLYCPEELGGDAPQLPSPHMPHGVPAEGVELLDNADEVIAAIEAAETLAELGKAWTGEMAIYERYSAADRKLISRRYHARKRKLEKGDRDLDKAAAAAVEGDL